MDLTPEQEGALGKTGTAGNRGKGIRSDCFVTLELTEKGGFEIELTSKVKKLYGDPIVQLCEEELQIGRAHV